MASLEQAEKDYRTVLQKIQDARRVAAPEADTSDLDRAEQEAKELYQQRANRSEWLGVAERVGDALVRLGAAQQGLRQGVDLSGVSTGTPIDWEKRVDRYGREYTGEVGRLGGLRKERLSAQEREQSRLDTEYEDTLARMKPELEFAGTKYRTEAEALKAAARDAEAYRRQQASAISAESRADARARALQERESLRTDLALGKEERARQERSLQDQISQGRKELESATAAATILSKQDDLSPKALAKLEEKYPGLLGKAGITPEQLGAIEKKAEVPGRLYGTNLDTEVRNSLIQKEILDKKASALRSLQEALNKLSTVREGQTPPADDKVKVKNKDGVIGLIPRSQLQSALSQGYTEVK